MNIADSTLLWKSKRHYTESKPAENSVEYYMESKNRLTVSLAVSVLTFELVLLSVKEPISSTSFSISVELFSFIVLPSQLSLSDSCRLWII